MKLTDTFIRRVNGNEKVQKHSDGGGLFLYVTPTGKKSWRLAYRFAGKQKLLVIGPYPAVSLKEAREQREAAKKLLVDNVDPSTAKQTAKVLAADAARNSFETVAREWLEKYSGSWVPHYKATVQGRLEQNIFPSLGKRPIKSISAPELLAVLRRIEGQSLTTAHRAMRECGRIFRYAIATGRGERDIAADLRGALTPQTDTHYATITEPKAIGTLLRALDSYTGRFPVCCALRLGPLVFVRSKELAEAEWSEFDLEKAEWRIPAARMKMKQTHIVPLSRQALAILHELHAFSGQERFVFPGHSQEPHINKATLVTALRRMGYGKDQMSFHSFRSMASTLLNEQGYNRDWVERQLAHSERNGVRAAYNYAEYLPERRRMLQEWADYLDGLREQTKTEE